MRYIELAKWEGKRQLLIAGHLTAQEIYEYKLQGYWMLHQERIDYRVRGRKVS